MGSARGVAPNSGVEPDLPRPDAFGWKVHSGSEDAGGPIDEANAFIDKYLKECAKR